MRKLTLDPKITNLMNEYHERLTKLQAEREEEIEEFMEEHAEIKFRSFQEIKKRFTVKIALATKSKETDKIIELQT